jgi:hypothetical protein
MVRCTRSLEYPEETSDLSQVPDKLHHIILDVVHFAWAGFKLITLVVIGIDSISDYGPRYNWNVVESDVKHHSNNHNPLLQVCIKDTIIIFLWYRYWLRTLMQSVFKLITLVVIGIDSISDYGVNRHFQQYFSYILTVSFICSGIQSKRRIPSTCRKSLTNFITLSCIEYTSPWEGFELVTLVVILGMVHPILCDEVCRGLETDR